VQRTPRGVFCTLETVFQFRSHVDANVLCCAVRIDCRPPVGHIACEFGVRRDRLRPSDIAG
jgi:hypothetical protein